MQINSVLLASIGIALPLTLITLVYMLGGYHWRTYRLSIDVGRSESERAAARAAADEAAEESHDPENPPHLRGPGGLRGRIRRGLYTFYRRG
jgi:hypothetical protein